VLSLVLLGVLASGPAVTATAPRPDTPAIARKQPKSHYPALAAMHQIEGTVVLELTVSSTGDVTDAHVLESAPLLDEAAIADARQWKYEPARHDGVPVESVVREEVSFGDARTQGPSFIDAGRPTRKIPQLLARLHSPNRDERANAAWQLSGVSEPGPEVVAALIEARHDRERVVRHRAALALFLAGRSADLDEAPDVRATHRLFPRCPEKGAPSNDAVEVEMLVSEVGRVLHARAVGPKTPLADVAVRAATHWLYAPRPADGATTFVTRATIAFHCAAH